MIDARADVGVPIITDCPAFVTFGGVTYAISADAFRYPTTIQWEWRT